VKEITPEGIHYIYLSRDDAINTHWETDLKDIDLNLLKARGVTGLKSIELSQPPEPYMLEQIQNRQDIRVVFLILPFKATLAVVYYLLWADGTDLARLDRDVETGDYQDSQFERSIPTHYQSTICFECLSTWHSLVLDGGFPYGSRTLALSKEAHFKTLRCPNCGEYFRQSVVLIFEKAGIAPKPPWKP
jgi:hypothetical protein